MSEILSIALTGGPSGGKSTLQRTIGEQLPQAYLVPEAATLLLSGGFPAPEQQYPWSQNWQNEFQRAVASTQIGLEGISKQRATRRRAACIVYDRGLPDGAAYLPRGLRDLEALTGQTESEMLSRYDVVLHLPSTAVTNTYDKASNTHRFEEVEVAKHLESRILEVWQNHSNRLIIASPDKQERIATALGIISCLISV